MRRDTLFQGKSMMDKAITMTYKNVERARIIRHLRGIEVNHMDISTMLMDADDDIETCMLIEKDQGGMRDEEKIIHSALDSDSNPDRRGRCVLFHGFKTCL
jgi:hypothetical protein